MNKGFFFITAFAVTILISVVACSDISDNPAAPEGSSFANDKFANLSNNDITSLAKGGFTHGIVIPVDGEDYYFAGAPDGLNGAKDIPGHSELH